MNLKTLLALTFALAFLALPARADDDKAEDNPCLADAAKVCPDMKPGDGKFGPCMKEHKDELSEACRDKMKKRGRKKEEADADCKDEAAKTCPDLKPGDGKFGPCMKEHKDELSPKCRAKIAKMLAGKRGKKDGDEAEGGDDSCKAEAQKLCPDMKPGDGQFGPCLKEHKDDLSEKCRGKVGHMMAAMRRRKGQDEDDAKPAASDDQKQSGDDQKDSGGDEKDGDQGDN